MDWLADIIHNLYAHGISTILATPSAARPAWLAQKYPEVRRVRGDRVRELYNRRQNHCYTSPIYREKVAIIDRKLAERFGDDPAVILWHIGNEFGGECHCELCQNAFRAWLQKRYGSLDALNKAWNATFWSHNYTEWSQIESPAPHGENAVQGLALDWKRFVSYQSIDFYKWERDCVRELAPKAEFTVNMMYRFNDINYFDFAKEIDVASWDNYPTWHKPTETIEETALDTAMMHDLYYSLKGKPFLMMESSPSFTNWQPVRKQKRPGMGRTAFATSSGVLAAVPRRSFTVQWSAMTAARMPAPSARPPKSARLWSRWPLWRTLAASSRRPSCMTGRTSGRWKVPADRATAAWATGKSWLATTTPWPAAASPWISLTRKAT